MARYGTTTTLRPRQVLRLARDFFGPGGAAGLTLVADTLTTIRFEGAGGGVEVSARPRPGDLATTDVTILSREFDPWAETFLTTLADAGRGPGRLARLVGWLRRLVSTGGGQRG